MPGVEISVLGPLRVVDVAAGEPVTIPRDAHRRLLAILALAGGRRVSTDLLIDRFWVDEPPPSAKTALQTHISALRRILPPDTIVTEGHGYALGAGIAIDAIELGELAVAAHRHHAAGQWEAAVTAAETVLQRWFGEPYEELLDDDFARAARVAMAEQRSQMEQVRIEALIELGRHTEALPHAEALVHTHPLRDRGWELLAMARSAAGRHVEALRAIQSAHQALAEAGLEPGPGLRAVEQHILLEHERSSRRRHNLPTPASSFVGRARERSDATRFLLHHRLVTMTGVGGAGKSRLALQVARDVLTDEDMEVDECWLVELAATNDAADVAARVADALGLTAPDSADLTSVIVRAVADRRALLVLDNCEHVLAAATRMAVLLVEAGPGLRVLATSRIAFGVPGELVFDVPPLSVRPDTNAVGSGGHGDAVTLFVERSRSVRPGAEFTDTDLATVVRLCRDLDGLPLAIELAAGRMRTLSLDVIAERAVDRLRLLTGGAATTPERHRTMAATIAWSFDLLHPAERTLLTRLAVFRGAVDATVIATVCDGAHDDRLEAHLDALVAQSLVSVVRSDGTTRYRLLETVREYAWAQVESDAARAQLIEAHRTYFVELARSLRILWVQPPEQRMQPTTVKWWLEQGVPLDDVRAALASSRRLGVTAGVPDLAGMLAHVAAASLRHREAIELLETALQAGTGPRFEALLRSLLATELGYAGQVERSGSEIDRAVELVTDAPASLAKVSVLSRASLLGMLLSSRPDASALPLALAAMAEAEALAIDVVLVRVRALVVSAFARAGRADEATAELERLRVDAQRIRDPAAVALAVTAALNVVYVGGRDRRTGGEPLVAEALELIETHPGIATSDLGFVTLAVLLQAGRYADTEALLGRMSGDRYEGYEQTGVRATRARLRLYQGRLEEAAAEIACAFADGVEATWAHHVFSVGAEVAACRGRLTEARAFAAELLARDRHPAARGYWTAVLRPLVQAEVDAALLASGDARRRHAAAAVAAVEEIRSIGASLPPGAEATTQPERWTTYLALAEAELARLDGPAHAVDAWRSAADVPDTKWYREYAAFRLQEASVRRASARSHGREPRCS